MAEILLGSHVGMSGKEMFLGSVKEAESYGANALMVYTGAPQNTRRKEIKDLIWRQDLPMPKRQASERWSFMLPILLIWGTWRSRKCSISVWISSQKK